MGLEFESPAGHQKEQIPIRVSALFGSRQGDSKDTNATVRWTVAGEGLTEPNLNFCHWQKCKQIWPVPPEKSPVRKNRTFFNDVCLSPNDDAMLMMFTLWMMSQSLIDLANIASLRMQWATSYLCSKCIISPTAIHHFFWLRMIKYCRKRLKVCR